MNISEKTYGVASTVLWLAGLILLMMPVAGKSQFLFDDYTEISIDDLDNEYKTIFLPDSWKYRSGDDSTWADPDLDDWEWISASTTLNPVTLDFLEWNGRGWFRTTLKIDSTLAGIPLALDIISQSGEAELFINGERTFHIKDSNPLHLTNYYNNDIGVITFPKAGIYTLAVRYKNEDANMYIRHGLHAGFHYALVDLEFYLSNILETTRRTISAQSFFGGTLIVFGLIHMLLFLYYRRQPENLYFALFTFSFAIFVALAQQLLVTHHLGSRIFLMQGQEILKGLTIIFFMRFLYALLCAEVPKWRFRAVIAVVAAYMVYAVLNPTGALHIYLDIILIALAIESAYMLFLSIRRKTDGAAFFGVGLGIFLISHLLIILNNFELMTLSREWFGAVGTGALLIAMSVSLSRKFAKTSSNLENKLVEVKRLSEQTLEHERRLKKEELERKLLEADNHRKTAELEEARVLQLSLLPKSMPDLDGYDICAHMTPATEVGGDYYDFHRHDDGSVTFAVGDATGHGVKAGIIVATAKSFFHTHAGRYDNINLLHKMSEAVKNMNLHMMYMGMTLVHLKADNVTMTAAGMPPLIYYNSKTQKTELITIKGMPLGSYLGYPYQNFRQNLQSGDILLVPSDGISELFNEQRKMYEYHRMQSVVEKYHKEPGQDIMKLLMENCRKWQGESSQDDDVTMMIIKKK